MEPMKKFPFRWTPLTIGLAIAIGLVLVLYCCGFRITYAPALESSWSAISAFGQWAGVVVTAALTWIIHRKTQENDRQNKELQEKLARQSEDLQRDLAAQSKTLQRQIADQENHNVEIQRKIDLFNRRYEIYKTFKDIYFVSKTLTAQYGNKSLYSPVLNDTFSGHVEFLLFDTASNTATHPYHAKIMEVQNQINQLLHNPSLDDHQRTIQCAYYSKQKKLLALEKELASRNWLQEQCGKMELVEYFYPDEIPALIHSTVRAYRDFVSTLWNGEKRQQLDQFYCPEADHLKECLDRMDQANVLDRMKAEILIAKNLNQKEPGD